MGRESKKNRESLGARSISTWVHGGWGIDALLGVQTRPHDDIDLALDVLGGPLFYRLLITGGPIDEQLVEGVVELIMRGFAPQRTPSKRNKEAR